jgi:hypothetical protein
MLAAIVSMLWQHACGESWSLYRYSFVADFPEKASHKAPGYQGTNAVDRRVGLVGVLIHAYSGHGFSGNLP